MFLFLDLQNTRAARQRVPTLTRLTSPTSQEKQNPLNPFDLPCIKTSMERKDRFNSNFA